LGISPDNLVKSHTSHRFIRNTSSPMVSGGSTCFSGYYCQPDFSYSCCFRLQSALILKHPLRLLNHHQQELHYQPAHLHHLSQAHLLPKTKIPSELTRTTLSRQNTNDTMGGTTTWRTLLGDRLRVSSLAKHPPVMQMVFT